MDAAVAVQASLGLVEPQSSGLGGGAFLLHYDSKTGRITAFDGRETAPGGATPDMFLDDQGEPLSFADAVTSGRSTGVPGALAMLGLAHERHGRLPWSRLFAGVARTAEQGFAVPQRLARFASSKFLQATLPDARVLFGKPDGGTVQARRNAAQPSLRRTLRTLASQGHSRALLESLADTGGASSSLVFRLTVTDSGGLSALDQCFVAVNGAAAVAVNNTASGVDLAGQWLSLNRS